jgi:hypothetical protein
MARQTPPRKNFWLFLAIGYVTAFVIEYSAAASGDSKIFQSAGWPIFFLIWYGLLFALSYKFLKNRPLWQIAIIWAILGPLIEMVLFRGHIRPTDVFYCVMFVVPFWLTRRLGN